MQNANDNIIPSQNAGSGLAGALGTSIVRVLNMTAGFTGLNSAQATKAGFTFFTSLTRDNSHAHYYPGAKPVLIKIIAEEGTGRLL
ncbi:MAG: pyridine nucleotide-disulfide oxidoreductase, partial [Limisphaerales bacterium]